MPKCNVIFKITLIEKIKVSTPGVIDGQVAVKKATEKIKKKYKGKEVTVIADNWAYEGL